MSATSNYQDQANELLVLLREKYNFSEGDTFLGIKTAEDFSEDPYAELVNILAHKETAKSDQVNHFIEDFHRLSGKSLAEIDEEEPAAYEAMLNAFKKLIE